MARERTKFQFQFVPISTFRNFSIPWLFSQTLGNEASTCDLSARFTSYLDAAVYMISKAKRLLPCEPIRVSQADGLRGSAAQWAQQERHLHSVAQEQGGRRQATGRVLRHGHGRRGMDSFPEKRQLPEAQGLFLQRLGEL
ncbi:hypothetical protein CEXT_176941 [Caerostris extrusa]|uniref:Uncharacterized protein n=1 Tax=Caerostris extrusa TaxID=172846 RepID=A0AAV4T390_CAEEX|nr:hypothetical protein CEXT_176941 [Caerostris extrusa]